MLQKINVVTIGHVDHGKSTLIGRMLYDSGSLSDDKLKEVEDSLKKLGKKKFEYAFLLDTFEEERKESMTIDVTHVQIKSEKYLYTFIDCPGHLEFIKNMLTGASHADAALLIVSVKEGEGVQDQTMEHAWLSKIIGIDQIVVAVNKMDSVSYKKEVFEKISKKVKGILNSIGYKIDEAQLVPVSALEGENVCRPSNKMKWYKGDTLIKTLDKTFKLGTPPKDKPLRIPIQDLNNINDYSLIVGRVESGCVKVGDFVIFEPSGEKRKIKEIGSYGSTKTIAGPGENVELKVKAVRNVKRGDVCGHLVESPSVAKEFMAYVFVLGIKKQIRVGSKATFKIGTNTAVCEFSDIIKRIDPKTGKTVQEKSTYLKTGDAAEVKILSNKPIVVEKHSDIPELGRFIATEDGGVVAIGVVSDVRRLRHK